MYEKEISIWLIISIVIIIYYFIARKREGSKNPIEDKNDPIFSEDYTEKLSHYLSDKKEIIMGILGRKNIAKISKGKSPKEGFCFLTNKASYFMGKIYRRKGGFIFKSYTQDRINNSELIGIKTIRLCSFRFFILSLSSVILIIICVIWICPYMFIDLIKYGDVMYMLICVVIVILPILMVCAICCIVKATQKRSCVCIEYTDNTYAFPMNELGENEVQIFYKAISEIQTQVNKYEKAESPSEKQSQEKASDGSQDKMRLLKEASEMYEKGLLGEDEFNKLKKEIIENN